MELSTKLFAIRDSGRCFPAGVRPGEARDWVVTCGTPEIHQPLSPASLPHNPWESGEGPLPHRMNRPSVAPADHRRR